MSQVSIALPRQVVARMARKSLMRQSIEGCKERQRSKSLACCRLMMLRRLVRSLE
jgi:hypothetical protein